MFLFQTLNILLRKQKRLMHIVPFPAQILGQAKGILTPTQELAKKKLILEIAPLETAKTKSFI